MVVPQLLSWMLRPKSKRKLLISVVALFLTVVVCLLTYGPPSSENEGLSKVTLGVHRKLKIDDVNGAVAHSVEQRSDKSETSLKGNPQAYKDMAGQKERNLKRQDGSKDQSKTKERKEHDFETNKTRDCAGWVERGQNQSPPYYLTAVLLVRIYEKDKAKLTTKEMKMWLQYLRYIGVEHVYVYDAWVYQNESQLEKLEAFAQDGYITYVDWHTHNPYTIMGTQVAAYQHCIDNYSHENQWQAAIDIDEYPFSSIDTSPGFMYRYVKEIDQARPEISEITIQNYLFLGKPLDRELMIERVLRRTPQPSNNLVKPIYRPSKVRAQVHHNMLKSGHNMNAPSADLRMNHYWGARLQNWGDDTPEILQKTISDTSMQPIIDAFKTCEKYIRQYLA